MDDDVQAVAAAARESWLAALAVADAVRKYSANYLGVAVELDAARSPEPDAEV